MKRLMEIAEVLSKESYANRNKVGAVLSKDNRIISTGYNGTPSGMNNQCEDNESKTHWFVLHAEANAILFAAKHGIKTDGASLHVTMSPCRECSKLILQAGIKEVYYHDEYRDSSGIDFLKENNIKVEKC